MGNGTDPSNVTLFGESAGAVAVLRLLAARQAEGLFHRAIAHAKQEALDDELLRRHAGRHGAGALSVVDDSAASGGLSVSEGQGPLSLLDD